MGIRRSLLYSKTIPGVSVSVAEKKAFKSQEEGSWREAHEIPLSCHSRESGNDYTMKANKVLGTLLPCPTDRRNIL